MTDVTQKEIFHVVTATHDSRTSQRMIDYRVREKRDNGTRPKANAVWFTPEDELLITVWVCEIVDTSKLDVLAYNICGDHLHLLLVCKKEELSKNIAKIKAVTSRKYNIARGITVSTKRQLSLPEKEVKKKHNSLWTQKFGCKEVKDEPQLWNTIDYIENNREKHGLSPLSETCINIIKSFCCSYEYAFRDDA